MRDVVSAATLDADEILRLAASVDQVSPHVMAGAIVIAARSRGLTLSRPEDVSEVPGPGVKGRVGDRRVAVGKADWTGGSAEGWIRSVRRRAEIEGQSTVFVAVDGVPAGALLLSDPIRPDAARTVRSLRRQGMERIVMITGDRADIAESVGAILGVDEVLAERSPEEKVDAVRLERGIGPTIMVGDGINDAPALALADVGVALGARGATASSEAADVVLNVNRLDRLGDAVLIARRSQRIARQSVLAGMGMSLVAMAVAGVGLLAPLWGALLQELIDLAVIVNALRALSGGRRRHPLSAADTALTRRFAADHAVLRPRITALRAAADGLGAVPAPEAMEAVRDVHRFLCEAIEPHQSAEDAELYPALARLLGGTDPLGPMSRAHAEISHQIRRLGRLIEDVDAGDLSDSEVTELRRSLYGLYALLDLHMAQEDEEYLSLPDREADPLAA